MAKAVTVMQEVYDRLRADVLSCRDCRRRCGRCPAGWAATFRARAPARFDDAFALANNLFHRAVVAACRSPALLGIREALYFRQERYLWLTMPLATRHRDLHSEHVAIATAAMGFDADATAAAMAQHLNRSADIVLSSCITDGDLLLPDPARVQAA